MDPSKTPKQKAEELMAPSVVDGFINKEKNQPYYMVPLSLSKRDMQITIANIVSRSKELPAHERQWWKEVVAELKKFPK